MLSSVDFMDVIICFVCPGVFPTVSWGSGLVLVAPGTCLPATRGAVAAGTAAVLRAANLLACLLLSLAPLCTLSVEKGRELSGVHAACRVIPARIVQDSV